MNSILNTIKKLLGVEADYTAFDVDILVAINTAIATLQQAGVGPSEPFVVSGDSETWADLFGDDSAKYSQAKSFIQIKSRLLFDPPSNSFVNDALEKQAEELLYRLRFVAEGAY